MAALYAPNRMTRVRCSGALPRLSGVFEAQSKDVCAEHGCEVGMPVRTQQPQPVP